MAGGLSAGPSVPVRVAGGLLFELLGQSVGDPHHEEDDIPIVLRSWQAQNFLVTVLHVKGTVSNLNVLGIIEIQDLLIAGGDTAPKTAHEVIANLACRLARWDDRCSNLSFLLLAKNSPQRERYSFISLLFSSVDGCQFGA
eukprot:Gb_15328 [translate_table: standard]